MKLMAVVTERGYRDPRWATAKQLFEKGYHIKAGEHGTICEKWIFEKEKKTKDEHGNTVREGYLVSILLVLPELRHPVDRIQKCGRHDQG